MEKTYFEIKITFIHIVIMLVAIVIIGILLFYMGYKAGFRSSPSNLAKENAPAAKVEGIQAVSEKPISTRASKVPEKTIEREEKLYKPPASSVAKETTKKEGKSEKPKAEQSFFAIQIGAYSSQANAQNLAERFTSFGFKARVLPPEPDAKSGLFLVLVGKYPNIELAKAEKEKMKKWEEQLKENFKIVSYR